MVEETFPNTCAEYVKFRRQYKNGTDIAFMIYMVAVVESD